MKDNTFFIVCREKGEGFEQANRPNRDRFGWEFADNFERLTYDEAKRDLKEYREAMPSHTVAIRAVPIDKMRHDYNENLKPKV